MNLNKNMDILRNAFLNNETMSVKDIQDLLSLSSRQSVYNYIEMLKKTGMAVEKTTEGHKSVFYVRNNPFIYKETSRKSAQEFVVLYYIKNNPLSSAVEILDNLLDKTNDTYLDIGLTTLYSLLNSLENRGYIHSISNTASKRYVITSDSLQIKNYHNIHFDLTSIYSKLELIPEQHPFFEALKKTKLKIALILGKTETLQTNSHYIAYGKSYTNKLTKSLEKLQDISYSTKILSITYKDKQNHIIDINFETGLIVFSAEQNELYLLGRNYFNQQPTIIKVSSISQIINTNLINQEYLSEYYQHLFDCMWTVSLEPPEEVIIQFENNPVIYEKLTSLYKQRKYGKLEIKNNNLYYYDLISGLSSFANYLRQYGDNYTVLSPLSLQDKYLYSIDRTLRRYLEEAD